MKVRHHRSYEPKKLTIISLLLVLTFFGTLQRSPGSSDETASPRNIFSTGLLQGGLVNSSPVTETMILHNSTIVPDNYAPTNHDSSTQLDYPTALIYVSNSNHIYVTGGVSLTTYQSSNRVVVLDGDTNRIINELNISSPAGLAYDPLNKDVYVASSSGVTVISDSSLSIVTNITFDPGASGIAYNPVNNRIYVTNYSKNTLYTIDPSTNNVTTLSVATGPTGIVYDPDNKRLYVNCVDVGTVFEINATNNQVMANVTVNPTPTKLSKLIPPLGNGIPQIPTQNIVYDSSNQRIYLISKITEGTVSILDTSTNKVAGTVPLGPRFPFGLAYNSSNQKIYVTNYSSGVAQSNGVTSIISGTTNKIAANVTAGLGPTGIAYDPQNGKMYVACSRSDTISTMDGTMKTSTLFLRLQDYPVSVAYDPANHLLYVAAESSYATTLIKDNLSSSLLAVNTTSGRVQQISAAGIGPAAIVYDDYSSNLYVLDTWSSRVSVLNPKNEIIAQVLVPTGSFSLLYNPDTHDIYVANEESNTVSIIDDLSNTVIATLKAGKHPLALAYDSTDNLVYITHTPIYQGPKGYASYITALDGRTNDVVANFTDGIDGGLLGIAYDPTNNNLYVADWATGSISIIRGSDQAIIGNIQVPGGAQGLIYVPGYEKLFVTSQFTGGLGPSNARTVSIIDTRIELLIQNFTAGYQPTSGAYDPNNGFVYISNYESGTLSVVSPGEITDFNIAVTPLIMLQPTIPSQATITLTGVKGFYGNITLTATSSGPTTHIGPSTLTLSPDAPSASATLTLTGTHPGTYTVTIQAESGNLSHTVHLTVILTQTVSVNCGSTDLYCLVTSDSTISNVGFSINALQFNATGPAGTSAFVNVTVPKTTVPSINQLRIFLDNSPLPNSEFSMTTAPYDYLIHFSVVFHSSVELRVQFGPAPQTLFGIQTQLFYMIASTLAATLVGAAVVVKRKWPEISKRLIASILID